MKPVIFKSDIQGKDVEAYTFHCPGCESDHFFKTTGSGPCWQWNGDLVKPTVSPSIKVSYTWGENFEQRCCHFFIRDGKIEYCSDCTHALAGQTVDMVPDED